MNIDLRIRRAQQRVHALIDDAARSAIFRIGIDAAAARGAIKEAFEHQARSLGQLRRWREAHARTA